MTNKDFLDFVIESKKLSHDLTLVNIVNQYFRLTIEQIEKVLDFNYMTKTFSILCPANTYAVSLDTALGLTKVKYVKSLFNIENEIELLGDKDVTPYSIIYQVNHTTDYCIPKRFIYDINSNSIMFPCKAQTDLNYVVSLYGYTYGIDTMFNDTYTHPLIDSHKDLVYNYLSLYIDKYYLPDTTSVDDKQAQVMTLVENLREGQKQFTKTKIKIDYPRF